MEPILIILPLTSDEQSSAAEKQFYEFIYNEQKQITNGDDI